MKKLNIIIIITALLFTACDYNETNFPGYDDNPLTDIKMLDYTLTDADYKTIADNRSNQAIAEEMGVITELKNLATTKAFSSSLPAQDYIPALLASLFPTADASSAVRLTYNFKTGSAGFYKLSADDYTQMWDGVSTVGSLSPSKSPNVILPGLMAEKYPAAKEGDTKTVEYQYSAIEPGQSETEITILEESFSGFTSGSGFAYMSTQPDAKGWKGFAVGDGTLEPDVRAYSGNLYIQFSAHRSTGVDAGTEQDMWLVSPLLSVLDKTTVLSFEAVGGYFNPTTVFDVYVLDSDNPQTAGKTKLENWRRPTEADLSGSYTPFIPSGDITLPLGAKYIAFHYYGISGSGNSTTHQIDNVKISYIDISTVTGEKVTQFKYLKYAGGTWTIDNAKSIYELTAADYTAMGKTTIAAADAPKYLPVFLQQKYPYAQQGDVKVVVYKTSTTTNNADEYVYENGAWTPASFTETRTEQFIKGNGGKWVFDPTIRLTLVKADYQLMCDYVLNHPDLYVFKRGSYTNEEWYYGFNAYYDNIGFRLSGSPTSSRDVQCSVEHDTEFHSLTTDIEKKDLLWNRLTTEGMIIFLQLRFPNAVTEVSGIPVEYHITAKIYIGPLSTDTEMWTLSYKTLTSGTADTPPTFEFISKSKL